MVFYEHPMNVCDEEIPYEDVNNICIHHVFGACIYNDCNKNHSYDAETVAAFMKNTSPDLLRYIANLKEETAQCLWSQSETTYYKHYPTQRMNRFLWYQHKRKSINKINKINPNHFGKSSCEYSDHFAKDDGCYKDNVVNGFWNPPNVGYWKQVWSPMYEKYYYWNTMSDVVTWVPPAETFRKAMVYQ